MTERDYDAEMRLPAGKTCADCVNGPRCDSLFGAVRRGFTSCDYWPSEFKDRATNPSCNCRKYQGCAICGRYQTPAAP